MLPVAMQRKDSRTGQRKGMVGEVNEIHVNYMTRTFGRFLNNEYAVRRPGKSMADAIMEANRRAEGAESGNAQESAGVKNGISPLDRSIIEEMTMDEYKEYIRERVLALPMHASHMQDTITVFISDEGFVAMKRDANYEEWVINDLRAAWAWENPWARYVGGAYSIIHYGATKEECHAEMWNAGFRHGDGRNLFESMSGDDDKDDKKRKSEIVVKPDGTRYLVISEVISGMKVTVMSLKLTEPDELLNNKPDMETDAAEMLEKGGMEPV